MRREKFLRNAGSGQESQGKLIELRLDSDRKTMFSKHPFYNFAVKLSQTPPVVSQLYTCDPAKTNSKTSCNVMPVTGLGSCEDVQFMLPFALPCIQHQGRANHFSTVFSVTLSLSCH